MAYTLHTDHDSLVSDMNKYGIEVAFDGMETEFWEVKPDRKIVGG